MAVPYFQIFELTASNFRLFDNNVIKQMDTKVNHLDLLRTGTFRFHRVPDVAIEIVVSGQEQSTGPGECY